MIVIKDLEWIQYHLRKERNNLANNQTRKGETKEETIYNDGVDKGLDIAEKLVDRLLKSYKD